MEVESILLITPSYSLEIEEFENSVTSRGNNKV